VLKLPGWGTVDGIGRNFDLRGALGLQVGDGNVQVNVVAGAVKARLRPGAYVEQVRRIASSDLLCRKAELAELASFCLEPDCRPYVQ
jgi:hypothetical protein